MIFLITGQPGNGKTLRTLWEVEKLRVQRNAEGKPCKVYYHGIDDLKYEWELLADPLKWFECEPGSIIVIDECQTHFRVRSQGSRVPEAVSKMETHRHGGLDLFLITQHPQLIDTNVRKLAKRHTHILRPFGLDTATVYQWEECQSDPTSDRSRKLALKSSWKLPKEVFAKYKSAEVHTVKKDFPIKKLAVLGVGILVVVGCIGYVYRHVVHLGDSSVGKLASAASTGGGSSVPMIPSNPWASSLHEVRVKGVPQSAPYFDSMQRVSSQPSIAGCMQSVYSDGNVDCSCYSQQSTRLSVSTQQCLSFMAEGLFDPTKKAVDQKAENIAMLNARDSQKPSGASSTGDSPGVVPPVSAL